MNTELTLYIREGCHLCEAFREELQPLQARWRFVVTEVDIDSNPDLVTEYGTRVPVLVCGHDLLCQYYLDPEKLAAYFEPR